MYIYIYYMQRSQIYVGSLLLRLHRVRVWRV